MNSLRSRLVAGVVLVALLALGSGLRFTSLERAEPFLWDDAIHHLEGVFLRDLVHFLDGSVERKRGEARGEGDLWTWEGERTHFQREVHGLPMRHARPGHVLLMALALELSDEAPSSGAWVAAVSGTATLLALFWLIARAPKNFGGTATALVAVAWLAVDPLHVRLSREGLADADGLLFALLALIAYLRARRSSKHALLWMGWVGLLAGIAFTVQTRNFLLVAAILAWELLPGPWRIACDTRERWTRAAAFLAISLLPLLAVESVYYLAFLIGRGQGVVPPFRTYFLQVLVVFARHSGALDQYVEASKLANLASYPLLARALHGSWIPVALGFTALATTVKIARRERWCAGWIVPTWLAGTVLFLSLTVPLARYAAFFLPAAAWILGFVAVRAWVHLRASGDGQPDARRLSSRAPAAVWLLLLAIGWGVALGAARREVTEIRPGYRAAIEWMAAHGGSRHLSTQPFVSQVWVGKEAVTFLPESAAAVAESVVEGQRYLLVDFIRNFFLGAFEPRAEVLRRIVERCERVAVIDNAWAGRPEYLFEFNYDVKATMDRVRRADAAEDGYGIIEIYDLERCRVREAAP